MRRAKERKRERKKKRGLHQKDIEEVITEKCGMEEREK